MSIDAVLSVMLLDGLPSLQKFLLFILAERASDSDYSCWPSVRRICQDTGMDHKTVKQYVRLSEEMGLLKITRGHNRSNIYKLTFVRSRDDYARIDATSFSDNNKQCISDNVQTVSEFDGPKTDLGPNLGGGPKTDQGGPKNGPGGGPKTDHEPKENPKESKYIYIDQGLTYRENRDAPDTMHDSGNEYGQSDDTDDERITYNDDDAPGNDQESTKDASVASSVEREWLRVTGCPSYSPNDARAALKWVKDIEAGLFPLESYVKAINNAVEASRSVSLWEVYNNRNMYLNMASKDAFRVQNTGMVYSSMTEAEREYALGVAKNMRKKILEE